VLKLGVHRADQFPQQGVAAVAWLRRNRFAYHLLRTSIPPSPREIQFFEEITRHLELSSGVYRTTLSGRLQELDQFVQPLLEARFEREKPLAVADWAASNCITSAEWFQALSGVYPQLHFTASDLNLFLIEVELPGGASYILEADGKPLQYVHPPFVIPLSRPEPARLPINRWLRARALNKLARLRAAGHFSAFAERSRNGAEHWEQPPLAFRKISLVHPHAETLRRSSAAFRVEHHSIFEPAAEPFHVIRTMNILNRVYFNDQQLGESSRCVWQSLRPAGMWIVGRTMADDPCDVGIRVPVSHASVLEKTASGFRVLDRQNQPSEIEDLAVGLRM